MVCMLLLLSNLYYKEVNSIDCAWIFDDECNESLCMRFGWPCTNSLKIEISSGYKLHSVKTKTFKHACNLLFFYILINKLTPQITAQFLMTIGTNTRIFASLSTEHQWKKPYQNFHFSSFCKASYFKVSPLLVSIMLCHLVHLSNENEWYMWDVFHLKK